MECEKNKYLMMGYQFRVIERPAVYAAQVAAVGYGYSQVIRPYGGALRFHRRINSTVEFFFRVVLDPSIIMNPSARATA